VWSDQLEERSLTAPSSSTAVTGSSTSLLRRVDVGGPGARGGGGVLLYRHLSFLAGVLSLDSAAVTAHGAAAPPPATHVVASTAHLVLAAVLQRCCQDDDDGDDVMSTDVY